MSRSRSDVPSAEGWVSVQSWGAAIASAVVMLVAVFVAFALVPTWLLDRLATRVTPTGRDLIIVGWWLVGLVGCSWLFVRLQGRER
jgi:hypothetical protein